jgi:hypothetical protein
METLNNSTSSIVTPDSTPIGKKVSFFVILAMVLLVIGIGVRFFLLKTKPSQKPIDYYSQVVDEPSYAAGQSLVAQGDYAKALTTFQEGLNNSNTKEKKSIYDISIGTTKSITNPKESIEWLVNVGNNVSYPAVSRAYALQYAYQMYLGYRDYTLLRPFFTDTEYQSMDFSKGLPDDAIIKIHKKIESLSPLPITEARLAYYAWTDNRDIQSVDQHMLMFEHSLNNAADYPGMSSLVPPAFLTAAYLTEDMEKAGISSSSSPDYFFEEAINRANLLKIESTYQFGLLDYANYLIGKNQYNKGIQLLTQLSSREINPMIKATVTNAATVSKRYSALVQKAEEDLPLKNLLEKIGFSKS